MLRYIGLNRKQINNWKHMKSKKEHWELIEDANEYIEAELLDTMVNPKSKWDVDGIDRYLKKAFKNQYNEDNQQIGYELNREDRND